jgi:hypothetical protein
MKLFRVEWSETDDVSDNVIVSFIFAADVNKVILPKPGKIVSVREASRDELMAFREGLDIDGSVSNPGWFGFQHPNTNQTSPKDSMGNGKPVNGSSNPLDSELQDLFGWFEKMFGIKLDDLEKMAGGSPLENMGFIRVNAEGDITPLLAQAEAKGREEYKAKLIEKLKGMAKDADSLDTGSGYGESIMDVVSFIENYKD